MNWLDTWVWIDTWLLVAFTPALAACVWLIVRWRWYGLVPAVVIGFAALAAGPYCPFYLEHYLAPVALSKPWEWVLNGLLASAAALVALISLWAGYSRGYWFWRACALAAIPALLAIIDAKEPILFCLATMPPIAGGAWLIRLRQDRARELEAAPAGEPRPSFGRWSLRDSLLMFIVVGLLAVALRPLTAGGLFFERQNYLVSGVTFVAISLAAAGGGIARQAGWRTIFRLLTVLLAIGGLVVHGLLACDALGLVSYFTIDTHGPALLALGVAATTTVVVVLSRLYVVAMCSKSLVWKRLAGGVLAVAALALVTPLALIYPLMLPPAAKVTPLPSSVTYDGIQLAGDKAKGMGFAGFNAPLVVREAKAALAEPGNVWYPTRGFREQELSLKLSESFQKVWVLANFLEWETSKAELGGRSSDCLELAILQWRLGRVLRRGGGYGEWYQGNRAEINGCGSVTHVSSKLSVDECRRALVEVRRSQEDRPDVETVLAYDAYWLRACYGWRNDLAHAARWLAGEPATANNDQVDVGQFQNLDKLGLLRLRFVEARLALELYRREHGQWPDELQDLVPKYLPVISADPYSNTSLIYRRQEDSFLLYSVGLDGRDNSCRRISRHDLFDMKLDGFDIAWDLDQDSRVRQKKQ